MALLAGLILFFIVATIFSVILVVFKPTLFIATVIILGFFAVLVAVLAGPALVRAAGGGRR